MLEQTVELVASRRRGGGRESKATALSDECAGAANELVAKRSEGTHNEGAGPRRSRVTALGLGLELQLSAEVVGEHRRQDVELVRHETSARDVVERGVLLSLAKELLLDFSAVEEREYARRGDRLVRDDGLVVELVADGPLRRVGCGLRTKMMRRLSDQNLGRQLVSKKDHSSSMARQRWRRSTR